MGAVSSGEPWEQDLKDTVAKDFCPKIQAEKNGYPRNLAILSASIDVLGILTDLTKKYPELASDMLKPDTKASRYFGITNKKASEEYRHCFVRKTCGLTVGEDESCNR